MVDIGDRLSPSGMLFLLLHYLLMNRSINGLHSMTSTSLEEHQCVSNLVWRSIKLSALTALSADNTVSQLQHDQPHLYQSGCIQLNKTVFRCCWSSCVQNFGVGRWLWPEGCFLYLRCFVRMATRRILEDFDSNLPSFKVPGSRIDILDSPGDFLDALLCKTLKATRQIVLSSLYIATDAHLLVRF